LQSGTVTAYEKLNVVILLQDIARIITWK